MRKLYCLILAILLASMFFMAFSGLQEVDMELSNFYLETGVEETGAINMVTAILFDYRGFDTLGEATVIFAAATIISFLLPKKQTTMLKDDFSLLVHKSIKSVIPIVFILGVYLVVFGHLSPGGGFTGGVILAVIAILWTVVFDLEYSESKLSYSTKSLIEDLGALAFVIIGLFGMIAGSTFLASGQAGFYLGTPGEILSGGAIPYLNMAVGAKVGAGLAIIFNSLIKGE
ncbi:hydrogen gas-evolving membrane-bound hydrogenase subunit E [Fuchsiella alkaliacetigena]|uniref:hydrogen gas-evolving membrane-bound hydrogenase subunit E n=1 Tax=Fuchsiella alkaliacetigena TaxID=957042 RepID=UPI00200A5C24|nr:hydrogen gas-evolving membrane-bound hydrogenase subunit E [Fuchsiella alkaliacetigena]MCK8825932.1 sodium:proton antiporter [Fuchsiella alkaliacetigena]